MTKQNEDKPIVYTAKTAFLEVAEFHEDVEFHKDVTFKGNVTFFNYKEKERIKFKDIEIKSRWDLFLRLICFWR